MGSSTKLLLTLFYLSYSFIEAVVYEGLLYEGDTRNYYFELEEGNLTYYNESYAKNVRFNYINRPDMNSVIVTTSFDLIKDNIGDNMRGVAEGYIYADSKWLQIPIPVDINLCEYYKAYRKYKVVKDFEAHSNITPCGVVPGSYYVKDFMPIFDLPRLGFLKTGRYKGTGVAKLNDDILFRFEGTGKITRAF